MATISLGNTKVLEPFKPDEGVDTFEVAPRPDLGQRTHQIGIPPGMEFEEALGHINRFIEASFGEAPAWVESDDELFESFLARKFDCPVGRPEDWEEGEGADWDPKSLVADDEEDDDGSE